VTGGGPSFDELHHSPRRNHVLCSYAAKTGSTITSAPSDRRVVFGFTGWNEPTVVSAVSIR
jgi:hypothetical protein